MLSTANGSEDREPVGLGKLSTGVLIRAAIFERYFFGIRASASFLIANAVRKR